MGILGLTGVAWWQAMYHCSRKEPHWRLKNSSELDAYYTEQSWQVIRYIVCVTKNMEDRRIKASSHKHGLASHRWYEIQAREHLRVQMSQKPFQAQLLSIMRCSRWSVDLKMSPIFNPILCALLVLIVHIFLVSWGIWEHKKGLLQLRKGLSLLMGSHGPRQERSF